MNNPRVKTIILILLISISIFACQNAKNCKDYQFEEYLPENSNLADSIKFQIQQTLEKLEETKELKTEFESYRLIYSHSLSSISNVWIFEGKVEGGNLIFKEFEYNDESKSSVLMENSEIELSIKEWKHVKHLIYNFNFWTSKEYKEELVADGGGYIIEGYRPGAKQCEKLERKIVLRVGSSNIDEINWLCSDLISVFFHKTKN